MMSDGSMSVKLGLMPNNIMKRVLKGLDMIKGRPNGPHRAVLLMQFSCRRTFSPI